jgi:hypothetical protein
LKNSKNVQIYRDLSLFCKPKYKLFHVETFQGYIVIYCQHLRFFGNIFETFKYQFIKNSKTGSMEPVLQRDFVDWSFPCLLVIRQYDVDCWQPDDAWCQRSTSWCTLVSNGTASWQPETVRRLEEKRSSSSAREDLKKSKQSIS